MLKGLFCFGTCILEHKFKTNMNVFPGIKNWPLLQFDNPCWDVVIACVIDGQFKGAILWFKEAKEGSRTIRGEESAKESVLTYDFISLAIKMYSAIH